jgi:sugar lactone lactonase YvrE
MAPCPFDPRRFLFNDGRTDPRGRFMAGTMYLVLKPGDQQPDAPKGAPLWRYRGDGTREAITPDAQTSNGTAFSPDGRTL